MPTFEAARDAYVAQLEAQDGIGTDREFRAILDFSTFSEPDPPIFIGMTQGDDLAAFQAGAEAAGATPEAAAFSAYENFDKAEYERARDAFLPLLAAEDGVLGEYQWVSPADPNLAVGMTAYESQEVYFRVAQDPELTGSPEYAAFVGG